MNKILSCTIYKEKWQLNEQLFKAKFFPKKQDAFICTYININQHIVVTFRHPSPLLLADPSPLKYPLILPKTTPAPPLISLEELNLEQSCVDSKWEHGNPLHIYIHMNYEIEGRYN